MATQAQVTADLQAALASLQKTSGEIGGLQASMDELTTKVIDLQAVIDGMGTDASQELTDAATAVKEQAEALDAKIPDAVVVPTPTP